MEIVTIFLAVICVGAIVLQLFLSKGKNRILYFILPAINFAASLLMQLNIYVHRVPDAPNAPFYELFMFLAQNAGTVLLLIVHFIVSRWKKKQNELRQMNIQDIN